MRCRAISEFIGFLSCIILLIWGICTTFDIQTNPLEMIKNNFGNTPEEKLIDTGKKCSLSKACPPDSYAFHIWSGAANIVGPKICFDGKIIMSHVLNNIGPGINIVVINSERGVVDKFGFLNMESGNKDSILEFLKTIPVGSIVLLASFKDVTPRMTDKMRDLFEEMGSTKIKSIASKDNWVFAGKTGVKEKLIFETVAVNDKNTNLYDDWPRVVDVAGCYPKSLPSEYDSEPSDDAEKL